MSRLDPYIDLDISVNVVDLLSDDPSRVDAAINNALYPVAQAIFETVGEDRGILSCNGHHMAQKLVEVAVQMWHDRQIKNPPAPSSPAPEPRPRLFSTPLVVIDTETTGLPKDPDAAPWEIAAVLYDVYGDEVSHFEVIGCPPVVDQHHHSIIQMGGIALKDVLCAEPILERADEFIMWLRTKVRSVYPDWRCTAFNVAFDREMLRRIGVYLDDDRWAPCIMAAAKKEMAQAGALPWKSYYNDYKMPSLEKEAAPFYGVAPQQPAHRALADARTAGLVAIEIQRRALARARNLNSQE